LAALLLVSVVHSFNLRIFSAICRDSVGAQLLMMSSPLAIKAAIGSSLLSRSSCFFYNQEIMFL
jgi:hypothetical protein